MPMKLVCAADTQTLWSTCADRFLDEIGDEPGPGRFRSHLWLTHRNLRDLLLERAQQRGLAGWLGPPFSFFSELPSRFELQGKPIGLLMRRRLLNRIASRSGRRLMGRDPGRSEGGVRGHVLEAVFSELLPEGVDPEALEQALSRLPGEGDPFIALRNRWVADVYAEYQRELKEFSLYDDRAIHSLIAKRIESGELVRALGGASSLHVYGIYTSRHRLRLLQALAQQSEVSVALYALDEPEVSELAALTSEVESIQSSGTTVPQVQVQRTPDAAREAEWVAASVKRLLATSGGQQHRVAVVVRIGHNDTRQLLRALQRAGVPTTARIRTPLSEIAALKALLLVFRGVVADWNYSCLRALVTHPYLDTGIDLWGIGHVAHHRRVRGLAAWQEQLRHLRKRLTTDPRSFGGTGIFPNRIDHDLEALERLQAVMEPLAAPRPKHDWLVLTLEMVSRGFLGMRRRLCDVVANRWDIVRLDQRGLVQLERLLTEWLELDHGDKPITVGQWQALLARLLQVHELALTTPLHRGVQLLEAHDAALVPFDHIFVVHANDGEFPRTPGVPVVLSDEDCEHLHAADVPLPTREQQLRRERSLWYAVTFQATPVTICYRTIDTTGTPLLPSLMVPPHDSASELPRARVPLLGETPVTTAEADRVAVASITEAVRAARHKDDANLLTAPISVRPAHSEMLRHALLAAVAETQRHTDRGLLGPEHPALHPNPWNGQIRDPRVLTYLTERFDADYPWSASALETYGRCPFVFLLERVLRIRDLEQPDEEANVLQEGGLVHHALETFYRAMDPLLPPKLTQEGESIVSQAVSEAMTEREYRQEWIGLPVLQTFTRNKILSWVAEYLRWELPFLKSKSEKPYRVEEAFGFDDNIFVQGSDLGGREISLRLCGRIDRIDRSDQGADHTVYDILDYKTSSTPPRSGYKDGSTLQAPLYLRILADQGLAVRNARYRAIRSPGNPQNGAQIKFGTEAYETALSIALTIPGRVCDGLFEPVRAHSAGRPMPWDLGPEITRSGAVLPKGRTRFDD